MEKNTKKYQIELTKEQLYLIAQCVEDIHRFMGGQTELNNCTSSLGKSRDLRDKLRELQPLVTPDLPPNSSYGWSGSSCPNKYQREIIAKTYPIYREIYHFFAVKNKQEYSVYNSDTLTCPEGGEPIKIKEISITD